MKIVKYSNRKLYNATTSGYITLTDIKDYVLEGVRFTVTDRDTGADLTKETIAKTLADLVVNQNKLSETFMRAQIITAFSIDTIEENNYTNALN